ncbi:ferrous iron transport protein B [Anaerobranca californiensis DSM 14826]|jgi:ferrous iron transport protein B|uniref:Ferrous iron transport protein B n=1 Tax=Anaerobranca californiensis DSM 14826 TaxID=1120989 RepID=A0A1M6KXL0_9FIRM|nr:ferrous iron transporter B [Anaerobranca californiensis]SHJ63639.1 ferrous iron transport protein B [Anaerobranca californiensis DSM 14826]
MEGDNYKYKILLMGNPNVGKSVIFSKLTGLDALAANYPGTTVTYTIGTISFNKKKGTLIDVPGTYSLDVTSEAEKIAKDFLNQGADGIIFVLDATNLERNLNLAFQVLEYKIPTVFVLNMLDVAKRKGIEIDIDKLSQLLGAPVIPQVAVLGQGLKKVLQTTFNVMEEKKVANFTVKGKDNWEKANYITKEVQIKTTAPQKIPLIEKLDDLTVTPWPGLPIMIFIILLSMALVVGGGKAIRSVLLLPLFYKFYVPFIENLVQGILNLGFIQSTIGSIIDLTIISNILVGDFGVLIKGVEWPVALVLPYVLLFYFILSFLEDSGLLPRLGILVDGFMKKIGLQGGNIIPIFLGYGCAVPAILGTRAATTLKERKIISILVTLSVPCVSQTGAFIVLLGNHSFFLVLLMILLSFLVLFITGQVLAKLIPGKVDPIIIEVPNLLYPNLKALFRKIFIRIKNFMIEAELPMIMAILFAAIVYEFGILKNLGEILKPLIVSWLGLPQEASILLILGIVRRELAVLPMMEMGLTTQQLFVGATVAMFYMPCISVFGVLAQEFKFKFALFIAIFTTSFALLLGGIINHLINFISLLASLLGVM